MSDLAACDQMVRGRRQAADSVTFSASSCSPRPAAASSRSRVPRGCCSVPSTRAASSRNPLVEGGRQRARPIAARAHESRAARRAKHRAAGHAAHRRCCRRPRPACRSARRTRAAPSPAGQGRHESASCSSSSGAARSVPRSCSRWRQAARLESRTTMPGASRRWVADVAVARRSSSLLLADDPLPVANDRRQLLEVASRLSVDRVSSSIVSRSIGERPLLERRGEATSVRRVRPGAGCRVRSSIPPRIAPSGSRALVVAALRSSSLAASSAGPAATARSTARAISSAAMRDRRSLLGDPVDRPADLEQAVERGAGRQRGEAADDEEGQQQAPADAQARHGPLSAPRVPAAARGTLGLRPRP